MKTANTNLETFMIIQYMIVETGLGDLLSLIKPLFNYIYVHMHMRFSGLNNNNNNNNNNNIQPVMHSDTSLGSARTCLSSGHLPLGDIKLARLRGGYVTVKHLPSQHLALTRSDLVELKAVSGF